MANKRLYVGNLHYSTEEDGLTQVFSDCGQVESAKIIRDRDSGRSKGFGFVEMGTEDEAAAAIAKLDGTDLEGRQISVNEARPLEPRGPRGGGGGNRGHRGGGGGGGGGYSKRW
jgi:cold-inducible RNA-binding protein